MKLDEIKAALADGKSVYWVNKSNKVVEHPQNKTLVVAIDGVGSVNYGRDISYNGVLIGNEADYFVDEAAASAAVDSQENKFDDSVYTLDALISVVSLMRSIGITEVSQEKFRSMLQFIHSSDFNDYLKIQQKLVDIIK